MALTATLAAPTAAHAATGLTPAGCLAAGQTACTSMSAEQARHLFHSVRIVISPDGRDAYTASGVNPNDSSPSVASVVHLKRTTNGGLRWADCAGGDALCAVRFANGHNPVTAPSDIALSADGADLYVVGQGTLTRFARATDGSLRFADCLRTPSGQGDCTVVPFNQAQQLSALEHPRQVLVTPDDRNVMVTESNGVTNFRRATDGSLALADCIGEAGASCALVPNTCPDRCPTGMDQIQQLAASPDGADLYLAGQGGDALAHLRRAPDGALTYAGCVATTGPQCVLLPAPVSLLKPSAVTVSQDGKNVYVGEGYGSADDEQVDEAVLRFRRGADGELTYAGCAGHSGATGCAAVPDDVPLDAVGSLLALDDSVLVGDHGSGFIVRLAVTGDGALSYGGCIGNDGDSRVSCEDGPHPGADLGERLSATADGRFVYGAFGGRLDWLTRSAPVTGAPAPPRPTTTLPSRVRDTSAEALATVDPGGAPTTWHVDWGTTTAYGNRSATQSAGTGRTAVSVAAELTGLRAATSYHYRVVASNPEGTANGGDVSFTTADDGATDGAGGAVDLFDLPQHASPGTAITIGPDGLAWAAEGDPTGLLGPHVDRLEASGAIRRFAIPEELGGVVALAQGPDGNVWAATGRHVFSLTPTGQVDRTFVVEPDGSSRLVAGMAAGSDGAMWLTETSQDGADCVTRLAGDGSLTRWDAPAGSHPTDVTHGPDGAMWFTAAGGDAIGRITPGGAIRTFPLPHADSEPDGIITGPDGALWFAERYGDRVGRISTAGSITEFRTPTSLSGPSGMAVGPRGHLFFAESQRGRIGELDPASGGISEHLVPAGQTDLSGVAATAAGVVFTDSYGRLGRLSLVAAAFPGGSAPAPAAPAPTGLVASRTAATPPAQGPTAPQTGATQATAPPAHPTSHRLRATLTSTRLGTRLTVTVPGPGQLAFRILRRRGGHDTVVATHPFSRVGSSRSTRVVPVRFPTGAALTVELRYRATPRGRIRTARERTTVVAHSV